MKRLLSIFAIPMFAILLVLTACQPHTPIPTGDLSQTEGKEAPDDIMPTPGGLAYRANFHQEGVENPWPSIQTIGVVLGSITDVAYVQYRDYIETKAGETRNNIISVTISDWVVGSFDSLSLYVIDIPSGISLTVGMEYGGPKMRASVLVIEISQDVAPGQYTFEIGLEINGKDYGRVPCTIKIIE